MAEEPGDPEGSAASGTLEDPPTDPSEEEPVATGTLFIMLIFLMALAALWVIMYLTLLDR